MRPFTRALLNRLSDDRLKEFILHWDALERLVIRVYKTKTSTPGDDREYQELKPWLEQNYPRWQAELELFWSGLQVEGQPLQQDPFAAVFATPEAAGFVGNGQAMQALPAAREALNGFILALLRRAG